MCITILNRSTVVVAAKSTSDAYAAKPFPPDPNSQQSTISTVEREIREAGGEAHAISVDVRDFDSVQKMVDGTVKVCIVRGNCLVLMLMIFQKYGRLDVIVYNSGAIWWSAVESTPMKRFQLMQKVNPEGLYGTVQAALPHFKNNGWKGRIIVVSPPIYSRFFRGKTAYAMGKVGMSVLTKGLAMDFERQGRKDMAITSVWPAAVRAVSATGDEIKGLINASIRKQSIQSAATGSENPKDLRLPTIYSDAILAMIRAPTALVNGLLDLDEDFLRKHAGVTDFSKYSVVPGTVPRRIMPAEFPDLRVAEQDDEGKRIDSAKL